MRFGIGADATFGPVTIQQQLAQARAVAASGFGSMWWAQFFDWDALTAIAVVGAQAPDIDLGVAVVPTYPRHPLALASQALTVQAAIGNRLRLGVGPSHQFVMEDHFGYSFERPARHIREYLTALGPLLRGESVSYQGETLRAVGQVQIPGAEPPSLLLSALGPALLKIAGELTDGTVTAWTGPATISNHIAPALLKAAAAAGRPDPQVIATVIVSVTHDPDSLRARVTEKFGIAGQMPSYRAMLDREGASGPADLTIAGDEASVRRQIEQYRSAGATELICYPFGTTEEQARTLQLLSALAREHAP